MTSLLRIIWRVTWTVKANLVQYSSVRSAEVIEAGDDGILWKWLGRAPTPAYGIISVIHCAWCSHAMQGCSIARIELNWNASFRCPLVTSFNRSLFDLTPLWCNITSLSTPSPSTRVHTEFVGCHGSWMGSRGRAGKNLLFQSKFVLWGVYTCFTASQWGL